MAPDRLAGTAVDSVISWKSWSLTFFALDTFAWCCHCLLIWLALVIVESWQIFWLPACCLDVFFLPDISLSLSQLPFLMITFSPSGLRLSSLNPDSPSLSDSSGAYSFSCWHVFPYSLHSPTLFTAIPILFPTFFSSLLSSRLSSTIYSSSPLYRLHISTVLTPILSSHLYFFHISTFFTSLLSSHLYILHISAVFTSLLSSHLYILHISALYISTLLTSHFYLFAISSMQQSLGILLLFNHRFVFASVFMCLCVSVCSPSPLHRVAYW